MKIISTFITLLLLSAPCSALIDDYIFKQLTVNDGLSQSTVFATIQDSRGYMWFGTINGLNRYDGYEFEIFRNKPGDSSSISSDNIRSLLVTKDGTLWIGTDNGNINRYNRKTNSFTAFPVRQTENQSNVVGTLIEHSSGSIWAGTNYGLFSFDPLTNQLVEHVYTDLNDENALQVNTLLEDEKGNLAVVDLHIPLIKD